MIEDFAIKLRSSRAKGIGLYGLDRQGRRKEKTKLCTEYQTKVGKFEPQRWKELALAEIENCGEQEMLVKVKTYCAEHCAWLHTKEQLEEYAMDCLCSRAYYHWQDFETTEIIWM